MFSFLIIVLIYWFYCVAWFNVIQKPIFAIYNRESNTTPLSLKDIMAVYRYGFVSDAIVASYLTAFPLILGAVGAMFPSIDLSVVLTIYNVVISLALGLLVAGDTVLYRFWNFKIDASVFVYLRSLKGATASVSITFLVTRVLGWFCLSAIFFVGVQCVCNLVITLIAQSIHLEWWGYVVVLLTMILTAGLLFLIIRGLKIRPNNPSVVYFSNNQFLNHWALNPGYNMIYSLSTKDEFKGRFRYFTDEECEEILAPLFPVRGDTKQKLFRTNRPNILLVVWESLSADFLESLGGKAGVAEQTDALAKDGVLFTHCTSGSFRTDRGLVCLLSGCPAQPTTSVIRYTKKLPNLPGLPRILKKYGYETTAVHGGDLSIMHKSDYYLAAGHDKLVSQKDMPSKAPACKWGVHDGYMFDYVFDDIQDKAARNVRWFTTLQTLSSHEPFEVPYKRLDNPIDNSFAYTDSCFGKFVERLKQTPAWDDLLIICVADHGLNTSHHPDNREKYAHIPLVMLGGAIDNPAKIDTMMSQTDLAATLLGQMGIDHSDFIFSRDVTADTYTNPFSLHVFHCGFMVSDSRGYTIYDTTIDASTEGVDECREKMGKAIIQKLYSELDKL